jgi:predicted dithiol-disulfide oxidoreductase (DUF899 family)
MDQDTQARGQALFDEQCSLRRRQVELARDLAIGEIEDIELTTRDGAIRLSELFGSGDDLLVIQNMGRGCSYCTLWADGFNGMLPHLENRTAIALVSPDDPAVQQEFASSRGWRFRMVSSAGSPFKERLGFADAEGSQMPGVSTFRRDGERIINVANDYFGPGDVYCGLWHLFGLLEGGPGDWQPHLHYQDLS